MLVKDDSKRRCHWCNENNPLYVAYHDEEWGVPCHDEHALYELFVLETFQAGLSWECILNKRESFRIAYDYFDIDKVCAYGEEEIATLMGNEFIIRNERKIRASINNSRVYKQIVAEFGSFDAYLQQFTHGEVVRQPDVGVTTSEMGDALSADLKRRGMTFVGPTTMHAYLQAIGVINAHEPGCFCAER